MKGKAGDQSSGDVAFALLQPLPVLHELANRLKPDCATNSPDCNIFDSRGVQSSAIKTTTR